MAVWRWAIARPVATVMAMGVLVWAGLFALRTLPVGLLPALDPPVLTVVTSLPGASPEAIDQLLGEPLSQTLRTVSGVQEVIARSGDEMATVVLRFRWGTDLETAREQVVQRLDAVPLPAGAGRPQILRFDPTQLPMMEIGLAGPGDAAQRARQVREVLVPRLEAVPGVAAVSLRGAPAERVEVVLDAAALRRHGLAPGQVQAAVAAAAASVPAGAVAGGDGTRRWPVEVEGGFHRLDDLQRVVVGLSSPATVLAPAPMAGVPRPVLAGAVPVRLADVATVHVRRDPPAEVERLNGRDGLGLVVYQEPGANTVSVSRAVRAALDAGLASMPGWEATITYDAGRMVEQAVRGVGQSLLVGSLLAVAVLWLFLRRGRAVAVIALAIPISACATLAAMHLLGMTLNVMSLGGLALSAGVLIDQAIVVLESIARRHQEGLPARQAADRGTADVAAAVAASTVTNLIVFLPVLFLGGLAGQLFRDLALANGLAQAASLLVAVTVVPALAAWCLDEPAPAARRRTPSPVAAAGTGPCGPSDPGPLPLPRPVEACLRRPAATLAAALVMVLASLPAAARLGTEFLPAVDEGAVDVAVTLPEGSALPVTAEALQAVERAVRGLPGVETVIARAGGGPWPGEEGAAHQGLVRVQLAGDAGSSTRAAERIRRALATEARAALDRLGAQVHVEPRNLWADVGAGAPVVELVVRAQDPVTLAEAAARAREALAATPGLVDVAVDLDRTAPRLAVRVDPAAAARFGLAPAQVGQQLRLALAGEVVARARVDGRWLPVVLRTDPGTEAAGAAAGTAGAPAGTAGAQAGTAGAQAGTGQGRTAAGEVATGAGLAGRGAGGDAPRGTAAAIPPAPAAAAAPPSGGPQPGPSGIGDRARPATGGVLARMPLAGGSGWTRLDQLAALRPDATPAALVRRDGWLAATLTARPAGTDLGSAVERARRQVAAVLPPGAAVAPAGTAVLMQEGFATLGPAAAGALLLIYMAMAAQFESLVHPLLMMVTLPLALVGAVAGLAAVGHAIGLTAVMGGIVLAGIAVNNGIVLVDAARRHRAAGMDAAAAIRLAWCRRLRPVLMTALTTLLGSLPMVVAPGRGGELEVPLAAVLVGGLFTSTALTLVVLPCAWLLAEGRWPAPGRRSPGPARPW